MWTERLGEQGEVEELTIWAATLGPVSAANCSAGTPWLSQSHSPQAHGPVLGALWVPLQHARKTGGLNFKIDREPTCSQSPPGAAPFCASKPGYQQAPPLSSAALFSLARSFSISGILHGSYSVPSQSHPCGPWVCPVTSEISLLSSPSGLFLFLAYFCLSVFFPCISFCLVSPPPETLF